jgi:hypothetical protein
MLINHGGSNNVSSNHSNAAFSQQFIPMQRTLTPFMTQQGAAPNTNPAEAELLNLISKVVSLALVNIHNIYPYKAQLYRTSIPYIFVFIPVSFLPNKLLILTLEYFVSIVAGGDSVSRQ